MKIFSKLNSTLHNLGCYAKYNFITIKLWRNSKIVKSVPSYLTSKNLSEGFPIILTRYLDDGFVCSLVLPLLKNIFNSNITQFCHKLFKKMALLFESDSTPYVMSGENKIKLEKMPITEEFYVNKAKNELKETPENIENGLKDLKILLKRETSLFVPIDNDEFLIKFLRPSKFYAESAFKRIQAYYKFRLAHVEYCKDLFPSTVRLAFNHSVVSILSPRDQHGRRIMFIESGERWNPRHVPLREVFRGVQLGLESAMVEPRTQVCGVSVILDMKGLSFSQIMQFTPSFAKMVVDWIQDCIPIRLKGVHIVNQPYIFNMLFAIFKPFLREKLRSRIFFHGSDRQSILKHIDKGALMERIGGTLPDNAISGEVMWQMLHHYEESFKNAASFGYITNNNNK